MAKLSNKEIISGMKNGSREVLFYLSGRYFQSSRRWLRTKGIRDSDTPSLFSDAVIRFLRDVQQRDFPEQIEPGEYLFSTLKNQLKDHRLMRVEGASDEHLERQLEIVADCFSILETTSRQILAAYYADGLNFEQLAARFNLPNPVVAEFEVDKSIKQLDQIVKARLAV